MELKDLSKLQMKFDLEHFPEFWNIQKDEDFLNSLNHMTIVMAGEVGEFANIVKKIHRKFYNLDKKIDKNLLENLKEELTDIFIYVLITSNLLKMDLEEEYLKKLALNKEKFKEFSTKREKND